MSSTPTGAPPGPRSWLAFSASYDLLEMAVVLVFYPDAGPEWLGMQGDHWDAQ